MSITISDNERGSERRYTTRRVVGTTMHRSLETMMHRVVCKTCTVKEVLRISSTTPPKPWGDAQAGGHRVFH